MPHLTQPFRNPFCALLFAWAFLLTFLVTGTSLHAADSASGLSDRWFYASFGLRSDADADELIGIIRDAASVDLNGMLWACGMDYCQTWSETSKSRFHRIKAAADEAGIEIIPIIWSVGYGTMLGKNPNLVEGLPIKDLQVIARNGKVELSSTSEVPQITNGGFEEFDGKRFAGYGFHDDPGTISFCDTEVKHGGNSSIRLENFTANQYGHGRVFQRLKVTPHRNYQIKLWFKSKDLTKRGVFRIQLFGKNGSLASAAPSIPEDGNQDWKQATLSFTTDEESELLFYVGIWDGEDGTLWIDDMTIESKDLTPPLQRPGTPITVKNAKTGQIYEQGRDFIPEKFSFGIFRSGIQKSPILLPEGSRIAEGTDLTMTFYVPALTLQGQTSSCMSEPELYQQFEESAAEIMKLLAPKKWFLSMDEIRAANTCKACEDRNLPLSQILGDCLTRQYQIIQKAQPGAQVYVWSDMLDPNHNCHADYMLCRGDYSGVWDFIPKELIISCWYHEKREASMAFFAGHGFRTQAAAYYDADTLDSSRDWLELCKKTENCTGIIFTTWRHRYELLKDFGKMLQKP